ncbi:histone-lysine N-methyltransferase SETMAR-like [Anoplophora glabripennis]|uniref:histone-lysine N-methyltransferase SETMAR-like n=1 Tax=Anoplophora glabripennis TaxID=217634 RepID=UPI00087377FF|nr:histone-lysine N-methyltransferase SETMAR-like [Anoplophora glabripennis]
MHNQCCYCELLNAVKAAYRRKRPIREAILHHDNARLHATALTVSKLEEMHWTQLDHPPYSPYLSPAIFICLGRLNKLLERNDDVEGFVHSSFYDVAINKPFFSLGKCISKAENYVEK